MPATHAHDPAKSDVSRPGEGARPRSPARLITAIVAAGAIAAFSTPRLAHAAPPTLPDDAPAPASDPSPAPTSAPVMPAGAAPPAPRVDDKLSLTGRAVWDGLEGQRVTLGLANEVELRGTVIAHDGSSIALARASDGSVVSVPKSEIKAVRMAAPTTPAQGNPVGTRTLDSGRGQYAGGVVMLGFGVPLGLSGTIMLGLCAPCVYIHLPLLLPGIGLIIGGSIAIRRAKRKNERFRQEWGIPMAGRLRMTPNLALNRGGGELGFTLRF